MGNTVARSEITSEVWRFLVLWWDEVSTYSRLSAEESDALIRDLESFIASELGQPKMIERLWPFYQRRSAPKFASRVREQVNLITELIYQLRIHAFESKPWVTKGSHVHLQGLAEITATYASLRASLAAVFAAMRQSRALEQIRTLVPPEHDDEDEDEDEDYEHEYVEIDEGLSEFDRAILAQVVQHGVVAPSPTTISKEDFYDVYLPLLTVAMHEVLLTTLRRAPPLPLPSLMHAAAEGYDEAMTGNGDTIAVAGLGRSAATAATVAGSRGVSAAIAAAAAASASSQRSLTGAFGSAVLMGGGGSSSSGALTIPGSLLAISADGLAYEASYEPERLALGSVTVANTRVAHLVTRVSDNTSIAINVASAEAIDAAATKAAVAALDDAVDAEGITPAAAAAAADAKMAASIGSAATGPQGQGFEGNVVDVSVAVSKLVASRVESEAAARKTHADRSAPKHPIYSLRAGASAADQEQALRGSGTYNYTQEYGSSDLISRPAVPKELRFEDYSPIITTTSIASIAPPSALSATAAAGTAPVAGSVAGADLGGSAVISQLRRALIVGPGGSDLLSHLPVLSAHAPFLTVPAMLPPTAPLFNLRVSVSGLVPHALAPLDPRFRPLELPTSPALIRVAATLYRGLWERRERALVTSLLHGMPTRAAAGAGATSSNKLPGSRRGSFVSGIGGSFDGSGNGSRRGSLSGSIGGGSGPGSRSNSIRRGSIRSGSLPGAGSRSNSISSDAGAPDAAGAAGEGAGESSLSVDFITAPSNSNDPRVAPALSFDPSLFAIVSAAVILPGGRREWATLTEPRPLAAVVGAHGGVEFALPLHTRFSAVPNPLAPGADGRGGITVHKADPSAAGNAATAGNLAVAGESALTAPVAGTTLRIGMGGAHGDGVLIGLSARGDGSIESEVAPPGSETAAGALSKRAKESGAVFAPPTNAGAGTGSLVVAGSHVAVATTDLPPTTQDDALVASVFPRSSDAPLGLTTPAAYATATAHSYETRLPEGSPSIRIAVHVVRLTRRSDAVGRDEAAAAGIAAVGQHSEMGLGSMLAAALDDAVAASGSGKADAADGVVVAGDDDDAEAEDESSLTPEAKAAKAAHGKTKMEPSVAAATAVTLASLASKGFQDHADSSLLIDPEELTLDFVGTLGATPVLPLGAVINPATVGRALNARRNGKGDNDSDLDCISSKVPLSQLVSMPSFAPAATPLAGSRAAKAAEHAAAGADMTWDVNDHAAAAAAATALAAGKSPSEVAAAARAASTSRPPAPAAAQDQPPAPSADDLSAAFYTRLSRPSPSASLAAGSATLTLTPVPCARAELEIVAAYPSTARKTTTPDAPALAELLSSVLASETVFPCPPPPIEFTSSVGSAVVSMPTVGGSGAAGSAVSPAAATSGIVGVMGMHWSNPSAVGLALRAGEVARVHNPANHNYTPGADADAGLAAGMREPPSLAQLASRVDWEALAWASYHATSSALVTKSALQRLRLGVSTQGAEQVGLTKLIHARSRQVAWYIRQKELRKQERLAVAAALVAHERGLPAPGEAAADKEEEDAEEEAKESGDKDGKDGKDGKDSDGKKNARRPNNYIQPLVATVMTEEAAKLLASVRQFASDVAEDAKDFGTVAVMYVPGTDPRVPLIDPASGELLHDVRLRTKRQWALREKAVRDCTAFEADPSLTTLGEVVAAIAKGDLLAKEVDALSESEAMELASALEVAAEEAKAAAKAEVTRRAVEDHESQERARRKQEKLDEESESAAEASMKSLFGLSTLLTKVMPKEEEVVEEKPDYLAVQIAVEETRERARMRANDKWNKMNNPSSADPYAIAPDVLVTLFAEDGPLPPPEQIPEPENDGPDEVSAIMVRERLSSQGVFTPVPEREAEKDASWGGGRPRARARPVPRVGSKAIAAAATADDLRLAPGDASDEDAAEEESASEPEEEWGKLTPATKAAIVLARQSKFKEDEDMPPTDPSLVEKAREAYGEAASLEELDRLYATEWVELVEVVNAKTEAEKAAFETAIAEAEAAAAERNAALRAEADSHRTQATLSGRKGMEARRKIAMLEAQLVSVDHETVRRAAGKGARPKLSSIGRRIAAERKRLQEAGLYTADPDMNGVTRATPMLLLEVRQARLRAKAASIKTGPEDLELDPTAEKRKEALLKKADALAEEAQKLLAQQPPQPLTHLFHVSPSLAKDTDDLYSAPTTALVSADSSAAATTEEEPASYGNDEDDDDAEKVNSAYLSLATIAAAAALDTVPAPSGIATTGDDAPLPLRTSATLPPGAASGAFSISAAAGEQLAWQYADLWGRSAAEAPATRVARKRAVAEARASASVQAAAIHRPAPTGSAGAQAIAAVASGRAPPSAPVDTLMLNAAWADEMASAAAVLARPERRPRKYGRSGTAVLLPPPTLSASSMFSFTDISGELKEEEEEEGSSAEPSSLLDLIEVADAPPAVGVPEEEEESAQVVAQEKDFDPFAAAAKAAARAQAKKVLKRRVRRSRKEDAARAKALATLAELEAESEDDLDDQPRSTTEPRDTVVVPLPPASTAPPMRPPPRPQTPGPAPRASSLSPSASPLVLGETGDETDVDDLEDVAHADEEDGVEGDAATEAQDQEEDSEPKPWYERAVSVVTGKEKDDEFIYYDDREPSSSSFSSDEDEEEEVEVTYDEEVEVETIDEEGRVVKKKVVKQHTKKEMRKKAKKAKDDKKKDDDDGCVIA